MSDLPKCRLCGADSAVHKVFGGIKYCCSSETCTMHDVLMLKNQWRTLMTQQAEPSQVPTGHVYLPEITPEMWETLGDTDVMTWIDGPQWTQIAVDFASMLPVKMPAQHPDKDRLRFQSACEISGDKHPEYVRGYEAAMNAVCKAQPAPIPRNERMPALADADPFGMVAWWNSFDNFWVLTNWDSKPARPIFTHWLPTGLKMPPAPGGSDE